MHVLSRSQSSLLSGVAATLVVASTVVSLAAPAPAVTTSSRARWYTVPYRKAPVVRVGLRFFGNHDGSQQAYGRVAFGSIRLWDAGVTWQDVETAPGVYDWTSLDSLVSAAQGHHVQVTLVLAMTPSFYGPAATLPPIDLSDYANYVRAVMTRYRDFNGQRGIADYQVWNEGNVSNFWTGSPGQLAEMTRVVHDVGAQVDPGATIVAPSFAMRMTWDKARFAQYQAQQVDGVPVWQYYDANALSLYPRAMYGDRAGGPEEAMRLLGHVRTMLAQAGVPADLPVWATEVNYGLRSGTGQLPAEPISDGRQVANVLRTYLLGAARGLSRVFWYRYDWKEVPGGGTLGNTLMSTPGTPDQVTPAGHALATARAWLKGRLVGLRGRRPCARSRSGLYTCVIRHAGGVRRVYWNAQHAERVPLPAQHTKYQDSLGHVHTSGKASSIRIGSQPVMVDSPR